MKIKMRICTLVTATALLLTPTMAYADTTNSTLPESYEGVLTVVPDENTPPQVAYGGYAPATPINASARAVVPTYHWGSSVGLFNGSCYSKAGNQNLSVYYTIDWIEASVSVYANGVHEDDATDARINASRAEAKSKNGSGLSVVVGRETYGSHLFEHSGYNTMEKESYAKA